ncbi:recombinase family protein, partial [Amycolatopsis lurida]|uniref:recombinase family protein n=1 Tax=Amycolatopsis lurida TaxID=31959 RepID=UPI00365E24C0
MTRTVITQAIIYLRLSDLRQEDLNEDGTGKTFGDRERRLRELADRWGWQVVKVVVENDVDPKTGKARPASAFKRRKVTLPDGSTVMRVIRPGYRGILRDLKAGVANGLLAEDLDRVLRDPRDLEDLIDVAEAKRINVRSLTGSLTLTDGGTDAEITLARAMVAFANKSSRDTSRRVSLGRERKAIAGEYGGGIRPFGFAEDGVTPLEGESDLLAYASMRVLQLNKHTKKPWTLAALAAEAREAGILTSTGLPMTAGALRELLVRPRNMGVLVHNGDEVGKLPGEPIVDPEVFRAVVRLLTDPSRRCNPPGRPPRWLGSGIYGCGIHQDGTTCNVGIGDRSPRYKCKRSSHLTRNAAHLDAFVQATLLQRIAKDRTLVEQFVYEAEQAPAVDLGALRAEADAIRVELDGFAEDRIRGQITRAQMLRGTELGLLRLEVIEQQ